MPCAQFPVSILQNGAARRPVFIKIEKQSTPGIVRRRRDASMAFPSEKTAARRETATAGHRLPTSLRRGQALARPRSRQHQKQRHRNDHGLLRAVLGLLRRQDAALGHAEARNGVGNFQKLPETSTPRQKLQQRVDGVKGHAWCLDAVDAALREYTCRERALGPRNASKRPKTDQETTHDLL